MTKAADPAFPLVLFVRVFTYFLEWTVYKPNQFSRRLRTHSWECAGRWKFKLELSKVTLYLGSCPVSVHFEVY